MRWRSYKRRKRPGEESAIPWRHLKAPAGAAAPFRSCRAVGRVSRTGVTRHRSPSSDYATLIRPTTTGEAAKIALTLPSPRGRGTKECAIPWRHLKAPAGAAAPQSRTLLGGEDCLSEASSAAQPFGTGAKAPEGPRPGAHGFGSFCRNKRTSARGAETPQNPPPSARGAETPQNPPLSARGAETPSRSLSVILDNCN